MVDITYLLKQVADHAAAATGTDQARQDLFERELRAQLRKLRKRGLVAQA
jgi:hypothetical protein